MYQVRCIEKIRDKNDRIIGYIIIGENKNVTSVKPEKLKEVIRSGQLEVTNLTLTSDNRLIDKKPVTSSKQDINIETIFNKAKILGYIINAFDTACRHKCYIASSMDHLKHIFIIPDDVKYIYDPSSEEIYGDKLYDYLSSIAGALKVIGGKGLTSAERMFSCCAAHSIDLRSFDTSNVDDMDQMFEDCKTQSLDLRAFDTSNVTSMISMFDDCAAQSIDLSSFNTSKVIDMSNMFSGCKVKYLDLRSFDTSKVIDMNSMFQLCEAQSLDLRSFNTSKVRDMRYMFFVCGAQSIDLTSFNTSKVTTMASMFNSCAAQSIDLSSFDTSNVKDMSYMFYECKAQSIDLTSFNAHRVTDMGDMFCDCEAQIKVNDVKLKVQLQKDRQGG